MRDDEGLLRGNRLELVSRRGEAQARKLLYLLRKPLRELGVRVEPRADRGAALGEGMEPRQGRLDAGDAELHLRGVARELLAEGHGRRVLQMRAADLDDGREACGLLLERLLQMPQRRKEPLVDLARGRDVHRGRE